ncbi:nitroreductase family protein [Bacillus sp. Bva_UNVM-123]|uniref:nitroreductase family protein n=1 Tax=Bacillus sp. Bva_UNVM-123 TaxID=2829798 RepID=UPI00391F0629
MNNKSIEKNRSDLFEKVDKLKRMEWLQEALLTESELNEVVKMHQKSTWNIPYHWNLYDSSELIYWVSLAEDTDPLPILTEDTVSLPPVSRELLTINKTSERYFKEDYIFKIDDLSDILFRSFGQMENSHRNYPSAGGLYPVIPILLVLDNKTVPFLKTNGSYLYDSKKNQLLLLKGFTEEDLVKCKASIHVHMEEMPNLAMLYAIDIRRAITKYKIRGYRHALIEVGLMAQSFRNTLWNYEHYGECCWSGFNDNSLSNILGLSPRLAPIAMLQWFGAIK